MKHSQRINSANPFEEERIDLSDEEDFWEVLLAKNHDHLMFKPLNRDKNKQKVQK